MAHSIEIKKAARKVIAGLPRGDHARVIKAIAALADNPRPPGCKKLQGEELWRIRTGDIRILYEIHDDRLLVHVVRVGHRSEVYRKL